jgi:hypothetical protein
VLAAIVFRDEFLRIRSIREGPIEHVSHVVLAAALVAWISAAVAQRGAVRAVALAMSAYVTLLLLEEIVAKRVRLAGQALLVRRAARALLRHCVRREGGGNQAFALLAPAA